MARALLLVSLFLGCMLLCMVQHVDACKGRGSKCDDDLFKNELCCRGTICIKGRCEMVSNLSPHDLDCDSKLGKYCKYPGSATGYCDCCPEFNPDNVCTSNVRDVGNLIKEKGVDVLLDESNPLIQQYNSHCKRVVEEQDKKCTKCGPTRCIRTF
ncbi:hypothetical protein BY458DRAFT_528646 [Sporodiniella umbellata]|nr:hypothetical protein BY458DRAFT_528646 [Sporodiniella umbellata]